MEIISQVGEDALLQDETEAISKALSEAHLDFSMIE